MRGVLRLDDELVAGSGLSRAPRRGVRRQVPVRVVVWALHIGLPLLVLWLLLVKPALDGRWEEHVAHFWLVGLTAGINVVLGFRIAADAHSRKDARLFLVAMAFLSSAGFLGLHALATPGVLVKGRNAGFVVATPVGLVLAACFAAASSLEISPSWSARLLRHQAILSVIVPLTLVVWGVFSLLRLPPLNHPIADEEARGPLVAIALAATVLFLVAAVRYFRVHRKRPSVLLLSLITAFFLLAEAMVAISLARSWQASWWEWHLVLVAGFAFVAYSAYVQYGREGKASGLFAAISLERTLQGLREEYAAALEALVRAMEAQRGTADSTSVATVAAGLGDRFGLSEGQTRVLTRAAEALRDERDQIRRLGSLVAVGREASVIREESDLLSRAFTLVRDAFREDRLRLGILHDGVVGFLPDGVSPGDDSPPLAAARDRALRELSLVTVPMGSGTVLTVPLTVKGRPAGVLEIDRVSGRFTERDHALVESLASQLSIALENARLYHELQGLFRQYMSPDVATALLADPDHAALGGAVTEVTVLFADLHGFTPFSERTSPERVVAMLNQYFGAAVPVILGLGGTVVQFVGDAVMAIFNAPVRQPDHALRAARAALGMQAAVEIIAANDPSWPHFRVGLNTGPALVGNIGAAEMRNFTAIGDTTNLAARLQTSAEIGQVVIGESTYDQIRDVAVVRPLGPLELKGKADTVRAYALTGLHIDLTSDPRRVPTRVEPPRD